jgi:Zn-dependent protease
MASLFGDNTAKLYGRLSLDPRPHIDPMGLIALFFVGFGWAKPVPVDYARLRQSRVAFISVSLAGCVTNILIATLAIFLLQFVRNSLVFSALLVTARINIILGSFNLIPIPPLDGSRVLMEFLPDSAKLKFAQLEQYGLLIIIVLLWTGILSPVITFIQNIILGLISIVLGLFA